MAGVLPQGMINVADIEIFSEQERANSGEKNSEKAQARQEALPVNTSERWLFGGGDYVFHSTLDIIRPLWIEGIGGSWWHPRTWFHFPAGQHGLHIHSIDDPSHDATPAGISQIRISADKKTTVPPTEESSRVAHGVVVETRCNFSHVLIDEFRGNGLHIVASTEGPIGTRADTTLSRFDSVSVQHCGDFVDITSMKMTGSDGILKISTGGPHHLQVGDFIWLESITPDPKYPRGVCTVTSIGPIPPGDTFECLHDLPLVQTTDPASGSYQVVVGNGVYTHGSDAHASSFVACYFVGNAGWAVLEDSQFGNAYLACSAENNVVGSYHARKAGPGNVFTGCWAEGGRHPSEIAGGIVIGGDYGSGLIGTGLRILGKASTPLAFPIGSGGKVTLGSTDTAGPASSRYMAFENTQDGLDVNAQLSIDFDQANGYQKMLGFGQSENRKSPAFLISGPSSFHVGRGMPIDAGMLVINDRYWLGMTRHETVDRVPNENMGGNPTWHLGDRAWNRDVKLIDRELGHLIAAGAPQGWICTGGTYVNSATPPVFSSLEGGTLGEYKEPPGSEPCTARTDGTTTVVLNKPSSVLKPAMYLVINDTPSFIVSISGVTLTMNDVIPQGGPGLPIKYNPPDFTMFGSIQAVVPVAKLPFPGARAGVDATAGARAYVSDANATVFGAVVAGGGANFVPVYCDGVNWRIG